MTKNDTLRSSGWRERFQVIWEGNKKPSRWLIRIILIIILYHVINWLWQNSLLTARWARPGKSFSLAFVVVAVLASVWMLITIWRLLSALGGKRATILLVIWYAFAVGIKLLTLPPSQPILSALPEKMATVAKEGVVGIVQGITGTPKAIEDFRFAYTGHRNLIDLPGVDETDEPLTGRIIEPNYTTVIETLTPTRIPDMRQDVSTPAVPTLVPESEDIEATPSPPAIQGEINIGVYVVVANTGGDPLRAHITPGIDTEITARFPEGSQVLVLDGPVSKGNFIWWLVEGDQGKGWCAESFLEPTVNDN